MALTLKVTANTAYPYLAAVEKQLVENEVTLAVAKIVSRYLLPAFFSQPKEATLSSSHTLTLKRSYGVQLNLFTTRNPDFFVFHDPKATNIHVANYGTLSPRPVAIPYASMTDPRLCVGYGNIFYRFPEIGHIVISKMEETTMQDLHSVVLPVERNSPLLVADRENRQLICADRGMIIRVSEKGQCRMFRTVGAWIKCARQMSPDKIVVVAASTFFGMPQIEIWNPIPVTPVRTALVPIPMATPTSEFVKAKVISEAVVIVLRDSILYFPFSDLLNHRRFTLPPGLLDLKSVRIFEEAIAIKPFCTRMQNYSWFSDQYHLLSTDPSVTYFMTFSVVGQAAAPTGASNPKKRKRAGEAIQAKLGAISFGHQDQLTVETMFENNDDDNNHLCAFRF